jgi:putative ABC transport system permease protein
MSEAGSILRYAVRRLFRRPALTALMVLPLAFGLGADSAIFTVVRAVLLRPLPYPQPDRLVAIRGTQGGHEQDDTSPPDYFDLRDQNHSFAEVGAATPYWSVNLTDSGDPERLKVEIATASLFSTLGVRPEIGHPFAPENDRAGGPRVVLLRQRFWQRRFGGDAHVVGRAITLDGQPYTVIGILPASFRFISADTDVYLPLSFVADRLNLRSQYFLRVVGRLRPGVTSAQAKADLGAIAYRLVHDHPQTNAGRGFTLLPLADSFVGNVRQVLLFLLAAVAFVLLIACANVANLLSAQAGARQREIALRTVLGAGRRRIVLQLLAESTVLALVSGALGLAFAAWSLQFFLALSPIQLPRIEDIAIHAPVIAFTLALALLTALLFGLLPALQTARLDVNESLKQSTRSATSGAGGRRLRNFIVVLEIGLSLVLLTGAGLLARSFQHLRSVRSGFDPRGVLTFEIALPERKYPSYKERQLFFTQLEAALRALPSVEAVGAVNYLPLAEGNATSELTIQGRRQEPGAAPPGVDVRIATEGYLQAMHIPLLRGRGFTPADDARSPDNAVLISDALRRRFWPSEDAIGKRIQLGPFDPKGQWLTVVGVVGDVRHRGPAADPAPVAYSAFLQSEQPTMILALRTSTDPARLAAAARAAVWTLDASLPVYNLATMEERLAASLSRDRFLAYLLAAFALMALVLGASGIYGVMSYTMAQRTQEIGIRMALGAARQDVLRLILRQALTLTALGLAAGLVAAVSLSRLMNGFIYGVSATDPLTLAVISGLMAAVALLASYLPARRAAHLDPMVAMRRE